jgi:hypothetical protein
MKDADVSTFVMKQSKCVLYQEVDGTKYEVDLPLTSSANIKDMMGELGLPSYVDLDYFPM